MIRLAGFLLGAVLASIAALYAVLRGLVTSRAEARRLEAIRRAQLEADARDSLRLRREDAKAHLDASTRTHPLSWTMAALPGPVLVAGKRHLLGQHAEFWSIDRFSARDCAWVRVDPSEPLHRDAVQALS